MSTHDSLIELTDTLIQQNGYQGSAMLTWRRRWVSVKPAFTTISRQKQTWE